jgi:predicted RNA binding protein YcfA (HicA-like mRNA interferase family)
VKKHDLERRLTALGWRLLRQGSRHEVWTNGRLTQAVPRHTEIVEGTARGILRFATRHPPELAGESTDED